MTSQEKNICDPNNPSHLCDTARKFVLQDKNEQGLDYIQRAVKLDPKNVTYLCLTGSVLIKLHRFKDARAYFLRAYELDLGCIQVIQGLGDCAFGEKDYTQALPFYEEVIARSPELEPAFWTKSLCLYHLKRYKEARDSIDICMKLQLPPVIKEMLTKIKMRCDLGF